MARGKVAWGDDGWASRGWELTVEPGYEKPLMQVVWTVSSRQGRIGL